MSEVQIFYPVRRLGVLFHSAALVLLLSMSAFAFLTALDQPIGGYFVLLLLLAVLFFAPLPLLVYSLYALLRARYSLERDGLRLRWGLRTEDIPLNEIEWVRPADDLPLRLPLPFPSWPGALLGSVQTDELGRVEYMASGRAHLLLVAARTHVFAISPQDEDAFLDAMEKAFEMGSLSPIPAQSVLPAAYVSQVWDTPPARILLMTGLILALILFVVISLIIPTRPTVSMGSNLAGEAPLLTSSAQIILFPILAMLFYGINLALGLFFFRWQPYRPLAYMLWGGSIVTTLLLGLAAIWRLA